MDDDEGYFLLAGQAVFNGLVPYRDFFFPQMPLSAYLYGAWQTVVGGGIEPTRYLTAAMGAASTALVFYAARQASGRLAGATSAVFFLSHLLVVEWATPVKANPLITLLTLGTLVVLASGELNSRRAAVIGLLTGVALASRLTLAPLFLIAAGAVWAWAPQRRRALVALTAGFLLPLSAVGILVALHPKRFWFGNVGYHALRHPGEGLVKDFAQKLRALDALLNPLRLSEADGLGFQTLLLLVGSAASLWLLRDRQSRIFAVAAGVLFVLAFLPSPVWTQYAVVVIGPAAVLTGRVVARSAAKLPLFAPVLLIAYVMSAAPEFVAKVVKTEPHLRPTAIDDVGRLLRRATDHDGVIAGHFEGYLAAADREILPPARSQFSRLAAARLSAQERKLYGVETDLEMEARLLAGEADAVAFGWVVVPQTGLRLRDAGWKYYGRAGGAPVWVPPHHATKAAH